MDQSHTHNSVEHSIPDRPLETVSAMIVTKSEGAQTACRIVIDQGFPDNQTGKTCQDGAG